MSLFAGVAGVHAAWARSIAANDTPRSASAAVRDKIRRVLTGLVLIECRGRFIPPTPFLQLMPSRGPANARGSGCDPQSAAPTPDFRASMVRERGAERLGRTRQ